MKQALAILFTIFIYNLDCFSQEFIDKLWNTNVISEQTSYNFDSTIVISNKFINDTLLVREQYYSDLNIFVRVPVIQQFSYDTIMRIDPISGELCFEVYSGYADSPFGLYTEYFQNKNMKSEGFLKGKIKVGKWTEYKRNGSLFIIKTYDDMGHAEGSFKQFYSNGFIEWEGPLSTKNISDLHVDTMTGEENIIRKEIEVRSGLWKHFDANGQLIEVIEHKWID